jgi:hypothetical protein
MYLACFHHLWQTASHNQVCNRKLAHRFDTAACLSPSIQGTAPIFRSPTESVEKNREEMNSSSPAKNNTKSNGSRRPATSMKVKRSGASTDNSTGRRNPRTQIALTESMKRKVEMMQRFIINQTFHAPVSECPFGPPAV